MKGTTEDRRCHNNQYCQWYPVSRPFPREMEKRRGDYGQQGRKVCELSGSASRAFGNNEQQEDFRGALITCTNGSLTCKVGLHPVPETSHRREREVQALPAHCG